MSHKTRAECDDFNSREKTTQVMSQTNLSSEDFLVLFATRIANLRKNTAQVNFPPFFMTELFIFQCLKNLVETT